MNVRNCVAARLAIAYVTVVTSTVTASAFYNPSEGRWLSRDPIGERGGENLNGFVRENPVSFVDARGLTFINKGIFPIPLQVIRDKPGNTTTTWGDTTAVRTERGEDRIVPTGQCYQCAQVEDSVQFDLTVYINIPNDQLGIAYTIRALAAILGHEQRHVDIYANGYNGFLEPANTTVPKRCGVICRKNPGEAVALLAEYLVAVRAEALRAYQLYTGFENGQLDNYGVSTIFRYDDPNNPSLLTDVDNLYSPHDTSWVIVKWPECPLSDL